MRPPLMTARPIGGLSIGWRVRGGVEGGRARRGRRPRERSSAPRAKKALPRIGQLARVESCLLSLPFPHLALAAPPRSHPGGRQEGGTDAEHVNVDKTCAGLKATEEGSGNAGQSLFFGRRLSASERVWCDCEGSSASSFSSSASFSVPPFRRGWEGTPGMLSKT